MTNPIPPDSGETIPEITAPPNSSATAAPAPLSSPTPGGKSEPSAAKPHTPRHKPNPYADIPKPMLDQMTLARMGVDLGFLQGLPRGSVGVPWPVPWRIAAEVMFINGFNPIQIEERLAGPDRGTIYDWAEAGNWWAKRDEHQKELVRRALAESAGGQIDVISRHLKELRTAQLAAMKEIVERKVSARSLEGVMLALVQVINTERKILGLAEPEITMQDNRVQTIVAELDVPADQREEFFRLQRQKYEIEEAVGRLKGDNHDQP